MEQRTCAACGNTFMARSANARFCPPTDADRARVAARGSKTQVRSRCAKRYENARQRGTLRSTLDLPPIAPFDCAQCGKRCTPGENVAHHAKKFCGKDCKRKWHHPAALTRIERAQRKAARSAAGRGPTAGVWLGYTCVNCGAPFLSRKIEARYCTRKCKARTSNRARRVAGRKRIGLHEIAKRDGWSCKLCGLPVVRTATVPHPAAPTLDHIVPIARGGLHERFNLQLAHFICNSRKGDGVSTTRAGDQLALV